MNLKVIIFNLVVIFIIIESASYLIIRSENTMYSIFGNTSEMWKTLWQNKNSSRLDLYSTHYYFNNKYGWSLKPNLKNFEEQKDAFYTTNSKGIRNEKEFTLNSDSDKYRIAVIGDSYTEGMEVSNGETWSDYLYKEDKDSLEVLNFGVGGFRHDQCLLKLKNEVIAFHPNLVLLGFLNCDIDRNVVAFRDFAKPMYSLINNKLSISEDTLKRPIFYKKKYLLKSKALLDLFMNNEKEKDWDYQKDITSSIINEMKNSCRENNIDFKVVFIPAPNELSEEYYKNIDVSEFCVELCKQNEIPLINLLPCFKNFNQDLKENGHWDAKGNEIIGRNIYKMINE